MALKPEYERMFQVAPGQKPYDIVLTFGEKIDVHALTETRRIWLQGFRRQLKSFAADDDGLITSVTDIYARY